MTQVEHCSPNGKAVFAFMMQVPYALRPTYSYQAISEAIGLSYDQVKRGFANLRNHKVTVPGDARSYNEGEIGNEVEEPLITKSADDILLTKIRDAIIKKNTNVSIHELCMDFDVAPSIVFEAIKRAEEGHYLVQLSEDKKTVGGGLVVSNSKKRLLVNERLDGHIIRFGLVSDRHVGSKKANVTACAAMYEIFAQRGIKTVLDTGNYIDGYRARLNGSEVTTHSIPEQIKQWVEATPQYEGMTTYYIAGDDHEGWFQQDNGVDIGSYSESIAKSMGRTDIKYLGYASYDYVFENPAGGRTTVKLIHPGGGSCFDDSAEILTKEDGWILFKDLRMDHTVATMTKDGHVFEWQKPTHITDEAYSGPMHRFKHRVFDFRVTPNHKLHVRRYETARLRAKSHTLDHPTKARWHYSGEWEDMTADEITTNYRRQRFQIPTVSSGWVGSYTPTIEIPRIEAKVPENWRNQEQMQHFGEISIEDAAELIAWYVTEGYADAKRTVICQSKRVNPENHARICSLLDRIGARYSARGRDDKDITIGSVELSAWLRNECGAGSSNKYLPMWLKEQPVEILRIVLETMIEGDGWINGTSYAYKSISKKLRSDVSEIAQKCGYGTCENKDTVQIRKVQNTPTLNTKPTIEHYEGRIYCCEVPNGLIFVRQNGKAFWSHNSYALSYRPQKIVEALAMNGWADVPDVVCIGHFHKASYNVWQGVHTIQSGCFQDQTTFMEKKALAAHVGGWIVEMRVNDEGEVVAINTEFFPMHNTKKKGAMIETKDGTFLVQD